MSLKIISFLRSTNVPPETLTGIRINSARVVIGTKIFKLPKEEKEDVRAKIKQFH